MFYGPTMSETRRSLLEAHRTALDHMPEQVRAHHETDSPRIHFQLQLVADLVPAPAKVLDVGGGFAAFGPALAFAGYDVTLVDSFRTPSARMLGPDQRPFFAASGVGMLRQDATSDDFAPEPAFYDLVTCIDSIEHWHRSPKAALHKMVASLKPGGALIIGTPNCVNLRKRITVPLGYGKWSAMDDWYETEEFTSHVREPDVADLRYIARDLGLSATQVIGRNWSGFYSPHSWVRLATRFVDHMLRLRPSLCSDLYLIGRKDR